MNLRPLLPAALALSLVACASASRVMISDPRPPIPVEQVRVYAQPPATRYVEIALLDANTGDFTYGAANRDAKLMNTLRMEAAKLGANGVLIQDRGQAPSGGGVGVGVGGGSVRHGGSIGHGSGVGFGGGVSVGLNAPKERARAVAIYVDEASPTP